MELRHLRYFVAVAEELNFSRAAGRIYLSQPALSQQIRKLEEDLGVTLFNRTKRKVELTEAGEVLLDGARRSLVQIEQSVRAAQEAGGVRISRLKVGFPEYVNHTPVVDIFQAFQKLHPYIELEEHEMFTLQQTLQQTDDLCAGRLDVGFLLAPVENEALETEQVLRIEVVAAIPEDHPLASQQTVSMPQLAGERLILFSRRFHPRSYDYIIGCCAEAGFSPKVVQRHEPQLYSGPTTYRMVASGAGIGIVALPLSGNRTSGVVFRTLTDPHPVLNLAIAWRKNDPSANLRTFLEVTRGFAPTEVKMPSLSLD